MKTSTAFKLTTDPEAFLKQWRAKNPKAKVMSIEIKYDGPKNPQLQKTPSRRSIRMDTAAAGEL